MPSRNHLSGPTRRQATPLTFRVALLTVAGLMASGCSVLQEDKIDYRSARQGNSLEVPPDLTQLSRDSRYQLPGGSVSASNTTQPVVTSTRDTAATQMGDVRVERSGNQRWLAVNRPADKVWGTVKDFWLESGFVLTLDQENIGVMETDWAENRAKLPQDFIRNSIGKLFESLYSTGERDKFRARLERTASGGTEIYISHRGMVEVYADARKDSTVWQPRPADPELEAEFMRRLMLKLGASEAQAKTAAAAAPVQPVARVTTANNQPVIQLDDDFDRAWRRVGLSLDRTGFTVEDRDRSQGIYFVRYLPSNATPASKPGLLGRLFSSESGSAQSAPAQYRIAVRSSGQTSAVSVLNAQGQAANAAEAQRMLQLLVNELR